jgi:hypothetical protein
VEVRVVSLTITLNGPLAFSILATIGSATLRVLVPKVRACLPGDTIIVPLNCNLWLLPGHFGSLCSGTGGENVLWFECGSLLTHARVNSHYEVLRG